ncbi:MAG: hypothetical protein WBM44_23810 [Waterburya sp.]
MTIQNKLNNKLNNVPWFQCILPLLFFLGELSIIHWYGCLEFDPDEGINLMKAFLVNDGYSLYQEIWNDQPPILTHILGWGINIFGAKVQFLRGLILIFSTLLLWQMWLILYLLGGILHAYIGCLFLLVAPNYWKLSISVMVGLPCITLAMGAVLSIILWHITQKKIWLIVSAFCLSLSVLTKLFTFFLAPIIFIGIVLTQASNRKITSWQKKLQLPALWIIILLSSCLLIFFLFVGIDNIRLLVENHTSARTIDVFQNIELGDSIKNDYRLFLLGLTIWGLLIAYQRKQWQLFYLGAWSIIAYLLLVQHRPVWYHQVLLWYAPAIAMVGYALGEIITTGIRFGSRYFRFNQRMILTIFTLGVFYGAVLLVGEQTKTTTKDIKYWCQACNDSVISSSIEGQFLAEIIQSSSQTNWIITDSPIFAFRAGIPVPPATAVLSRKQLETGNITNQRLINIIRQYQPEQIFFKRFEWAEVTNYLQQNYQLKKQQDTDLYNFRLYVKAEEGIKSKD